MQKYFVDYKDGDFILSDEQLFQIKTVMRAKKGSEFIFINNGIFYHVKLKSLIPFQVEIINEEVSDKELNIDITLLYCLAKKDKIETCIQKATELGVKKIVLVNSSRCVLKIKKEEEEKKLIRYRKIAQEASEQCGRSFVPIVEKIIDFKEIGNYISELNLIAYENEKKSFLNEDMLKNKKSVSVLIGAEGGFSLEEVAYANDLGYNAICLGKRILRSETAVIYTMSLLSHYAEK